MNDSMKSFIKSLRPNVLKTIDLMSWNVVEQSVPKTQNYYKLLLPAASYTLPFTTLCFYNQVHQVLTVPVTSCWCLSWGRISNDLHAVHAILLKQIHDNTKATDTTLAPL